MAVIKTLYGKLKKINPVVAAPVLLITAGIVFNLIVLGVNAQPTDQLADLREVFDSGADSFLAENIFDESFEVASDEQSTAGFVVVESDSLLNSGNPLSTILPTRDGLLIYKVQKGDTLSKIAANFGISLNTIFWANSKISNNLRLGQEIFILPVSGVAHQVDEGETVESVAEIYDVPTEKITQYNKRAIPGRTLAAGSTLVIPGAKPKKINSAVSLSGLPNYPSYYIIPTTGWNWGTLHYFNAIDVANACGTPIYASAEGLVIRAPDYGYNDGYGHYVDIEHPNNTVTRYAHMSKNKAVVGDYVLQGDLIGYIGNTGKTHGPTGCHLHFEIRGARNPFSK